MALLYCALAFMVGIGLGRFAWSTGWLGCDFPAWLWISPLLLLPGVGWLNRLASPPTSLRWPASAGFHPAQDGLSPGLTVALLLCLLSGTLRYIARPLTPCWTPTDLAYYNNPPDSGFDTTGANVTLTGFVDDYALVQDNRQRLYLTIESINLSGENQVVTGRARMTTGAKHRFQYGQPVRVKGVLVTPPVFEDFSYREYLARRGVYSLVQRPQIDSLNEPLQGNPIRRGLFKLRGRGEGVLNRLLPEPYAALANGMLLGIESGIPDELYERFNLTGSSHVIVISGSNVSIIAAVFLALFGRVLSRRRAVLPTLVGIGLYAVLVGGDAAVLRAALMGGLYVIATALLRQNSALVSLGAACWAMTLFNPLMLWDVGFQLSSAATAGLVLFTPGLTHVSQKLWPGFRGGILTGDQAGDLSQSMINGLLQDGLIVTLAANLTTLPLVVYYFGRLSLISILTNILIVPVQPFIMLWGGAGLLFGLVGLTPIAQGLLWVPWLCLIWTVKMVTWTSALPGASLLVTAYGVEGLASTYLVLAVVHWRKQAGNWVRVLRSRIWVNWRLWLARPGLAGLLAVGTILTWAAAITQPDGHLHVYFLDIGQGDGILIQTPSGHQALIDGGASPQQLFSQLGAVLPFWDRRLDLVIATHPDTDHIGAQEHITDRYQVDLALDTIYSQQSEDSTQWRKAMTAARIQVDQQLAGGWINLGDGVRLWIVWPPGTGRSGIDDNENSLVIRLVYGEFSLLLTGDIGFDSEAELVQSPTALSATVLKVGHHGSRHSTSELFVQRVKPQIAVIQVGENRYGHPTAETLERLSGQQVLRNDLHGRIHIWSDGEKLWLDTEKGPWLILD